MFGGYQFDPAHHDPFHFGGNGDLQRQPLLRPGSRQEEEQPQTRAFEIRQFPGIEQCIGFVSEEPLLY